MSRSGYSDDYDAGQITMWRGQVASAIRGRRGQRLLRDLRAALDAMPNKALIANELETAEGEVCALGAVGKMRGLDMSNLDPEDSDTVADTFDIARQMACEIVFINDEASIYPETPEQRYERVRRWVESKLRPDGTPDCGP